MLISEAFEVFELDELVSEGRSPNTIANYKKTKVSLLRAVGDDIPVEFLSYNHIIQWKKQMYAANLRASYMALLLRHLRVVLTYLRKHDFVTLDPHEIKIPRFKYRKTPWLTIQEVGAFLSVITSPRDKALFACQFSAGARISEILSLDRGAIIDGRANVWGKGKRIEDEPDTLEFDSNATTALEEYLAQRQDDLQPLFISRQHRRLCLQSAIYLANHYAELAGIKRYDNDGTPRKIATHVLRHSFSTDLFMNGADLYRVSEQLRHSSIEVTAKHYIHPTQNQKLEDFKKFHTPTPT